MKKFFKKILAPLLASFILCSSVAFAATPEDTKEDFSFKKLYGRQHTTVEKDWYEELPGFLSFLSKTEIWTSDIPSTPPVASTADIEVYDTLTLTEDLTVSGHKSWYADDGGKLTGCIPPRFGSGYAVRIFDNGLTEITSSDAVNWNFDYENCVLWFYNDPTGTYTSPFKAKVYHYIGNTDVGLWSSNGSDIYYNAGSVGIGTDTPTAEFEVAESGATNLKVSSYSTNNISTASLLLDKSYTNTVDTLVETVTGSYNGGIYFRGVNGSNVRTNGAVIQSLQDGAASATYIPAELQFYTSNSTTGNEKVMTLDKDANVGIGVDAPSQQLDISGNFELQPTTFADQSGIIYKDTYTFLHDFNYGNNGVATTNGHNTFVGEDAGNFTMGSTAISNLQASENVGFGYRALQNNTIGYRNTALGSYALVNNTEGTFNMSLGRASMRENTTGSNNTAIGVASLEHNISGNRNSVVGYSAGRHFGVTPNWNADFLTDVDYSIYIGYLARAKEDSVTNEIVIGENAVGNGSNTVTIGNTSVTNTYLMGNVQTDNGALFIEETTTPTARTDYGAIYPKTDNMLYFQDGGGTEHIIQTSDSFFAEMFMYESSGTETVGETNQYYAISEEFGTGILEGFTFVAGSNGSGDVTTSGGGSAINVNDTAHGLLDGDYVNIQCGTALQSGTSIVTYVGVNDFTLAIAYQADETCTWQEGDYLLAGTGSAGKYLFDFSLTASAGAASKNFKFEGVQNATHLDNVAFEITTSGTNHQSSMSSGMITVADGDRIWGQFKNETDAQDLNYEHANINLVRL